MGTSVMDVYTGELAISDICMEVKDFLEMKNLSKKEVLAAWTGKDPAGFKVISLSDESQWIIKYHDNEKRYVHIFPARQSPHTFRIKSNTLKSAILYIINIGKDLVTEEDLRPILNVDKERDMQIASLEEKGKSSPANGLSMDKDQDGQLASLSAMEKQHISNVLKKTRGIIAGPNGAARILHMKRSTLLYRMKKLGINPVEYK